MLVGKGEGEREGQTDVEEESTILVEGTKFSEMGLKRLDNVSRRVSGALQVGGRANHEGLKVKGTYLVPDYMIRRSNLVQSSRYTQYRIHNQRCIMYPLPPRRSSPKQQEHKQTNPSVSPYLPLLQSQKVHSHQTPLQLPSHHQY